MASASIVALAIASAANAQQISAPADDGVALGEIVVTARRASESLQEVPQAVSAITNDTLQKLSVTQFTEIQTLTPGLSINDGGVSLRGLTFDVNTGLSSTVALYFNDAPVGLGDLYVSMFDIGQIEVLRGPQGTTRGISAPSGAITFTTHRPDLSEFGGNVSVTATDHQGRNLQGAVNVPLIKDVLALRFAARIDEDNPGVRSIYSGLRPKTKVQAERIGVTFEPNDAFNATLTYQHADRRATSFTQVITPTDLSAPAPNAAHPFISPQDRAGVGEGIHDQHQLWNIITAQIDSRIFGQHLSYVGYYSRYRENTYVPIDTGNVISGFDFASENQVPTRSITQELRISSDRAPGRLLDYTAGAFFDYGETGIHVRQTASFLRGAFGPPGTFSAAAFDPRFALPLLIDVPGVSHETSLFGSLTLHLGSQTELTGGVRRLMVVNKRGTNISTGDGLINLGFPIPCSLVGLAAGPSAGLCTINGQLVQNVASRSSDRPTIYNVSLSHHFTPNLMVYANTGTSWRAGQTAIGIHNAENDPILNALTFLKPETSTNYEVGFKTTFLHDRGRLNVAFFRQKFRNLVVYEPSIPYLDNSGQGYSVSTFSFSANTGAVINGFDIDSAFQITRDWNVSAQLSYADGKSTPGSKVPCNDSNFDGVPDSGAVTSVGQFPAGTHIALCQGGSISRQPLWNASVQTEYVHPVTEGVEGFVRGLFNYYPENKRAEPRFVVPSYSLINVYAGVRSGDGAWEFSVFAKNAFNKAVLLDRSTQLVTLSGLGSTFAAQNVGYYVNATTTPEREVGVTARYAWGSR